ncbi:Afadin and alpha-actinin-binding-domain-containing protein [Scheffersomyces amazonensis]|uniref:Afadin and alpha-actinin-binding-domain-containing protein n=1 Tax=Scheffersomyces amazonensis TaxID=1078765 RepID=UPI00315CC320
MAETITYLDTEPIRNASDLINSMLLSRAYIDDKLKFLTIDHQDLLKNNLIISSSSEFQVSEIIYENDRSVINIIHSLLVALDRTRNQQKISNQTILQKEMQIKKLTAKNDQLEKELIKNEKDLNKLVQFEQNDLNKQIDSLHKINKLQSNDLIKLKHWSGGLQKKYKIELKKQQLEIDELKNKLLDKRNLSSTIKYGIPINSDESTSQSTSTTTTTTSISINNINSTINSNIIYNNLPIIDNIKPILINPSESILNQEFNELSSNLTSIIESIATENYKFTRFIELINEYYNQFNISLTDFTRDKSTISLPNPSDIIDLQSLENIDHDTIQKYFNELRSFELISKPILNNIYKIYHNISGVLFLHSQIEGNETRIESESSKLKQIEKELEIMTQNWKDALKTAENWKNIHQKYVENH